MSNKETIDHLAIGEQILQKRLTPEQLREVDFLAVWEALMRDRLTPEELRQVYQIQSYMYGMHDDECDE